MQVDDAMDLLNERAQQAGAQLVCHFKRDEAELLEVVNHTAQTGNNFWRKAAACVPFQITVGLPFVGVMVSSPDSQAAAATTGSYDEANPDALVAGQHSFIRIFAHLEEHGNSTCGEGCGYWFMGGEAANATDFEDPYSAR